MAKLTVVIPSPLSSGVTNAKFYDQAARSVGCISEVLRFADRTPTSLDSLLFYIIAPESQINRGIFSRSMNKQSIQSKVLRRVKAYEGERDEWFKNWFLPTIKEIKLDILSWEEIIDFISGLKQYFEFDGLDPKPDNGDGVVLLRL